MPEEEMEIPPKFKEMGTKFCTEIVKWLNDDRHHVDSMVSHMVKTAKELGEIFKKGKVTYKEANRCYLYTNRFDDIYNGEYGEKFESSRMVTEEFLPSIREVMYNLSNKLRK